LAEQTLALVSRATYVLVDDVRWGGEPPYSRIGELFRAARSATDV